MYRIGILLLMSAFLFLSCSSESNDEYFYKLDERFAAVKDNKSKVYSLYKHELEKYKEFDELKYLISSKYIELYLYDDNRSRQISKIYELLRINNDEYEYITVACELNMALQLEETSPKLSLQFLNEAIKIEEKSTKKIFLPHLYHAKGRWYLNHKDYAMANMYFGKALYNFPKKDTLYIASMYNNFALAKNGMDDSKSSINLTLYGIKLLENKSEKTNEENLFLHVMKGNLGTYYYNLKEYENSEKYLSSQIDFYRENKRLVTSIVYNSEILMDVYKILNQDYKQEKLVIELKDMLPYLKTIKGKIKTCEILQNYYADKKDLKNFKYFSDKLVVYTYQFNDETTRDIDYISDILNGYIIKNVNQKYDYEISNQRRRTVFFIFLILCLLSGFVYIILKIRKLNRDECDFLEKQNNLLVNNKQDLEKDIQAHKGKIQNLHLNLNLKTEREKAFLENLRKIRRSKNIDAEEVVKDLFFKINNLLQIDEKNSEIVSESSSENKDFIDSLSQRFPVLSAQELKLCVYFRLNLSSKEVSLLENITPGSVRVYKTKIKSKMKLEKDENLTMFLNTIK